MRREWQKMVGFERESGPSFDAVIAVSEQDRKLFEREYGWRHVHAIDTAADVDYFRDNGTDAVPDRVAFLGSMDWMPNQDGVKWFVLEVWPLIRQARAKATFHVVGRNPPASIWALENVPGLKIARGLPDLLPQFAATIVLFVPP